MADALNIENLPYSIESEQSVLGALILEPSKMSDVMKYLSVDSFYRQQHKEIYSALVEMYTTAVPIDVITVIETVKSKNIFATQEDARVYISELAQLLPTVSHVETYAQVVREKYYLRTLIKTAQDIIETSSDPSANAGNILDIAEQKIFDIRQGKETTGLVRISNVIYDLYEQLQKLSGEDKKDYSGLSSGFSALDNITTGLNKSDLLLIAARPAMGKTSFALNIATYVAQSNKSVAIFSLEMSKEQLVSRILSSDAMVQGSKLRTGNLSTDEWKKLAISAQCISKIPMYIDDTSGITVAEMKAKLRRVKDLGLVVIDYLQLMTTGRRNDNRVQEVAEITRGLKIMAKELDVPVITLSQLSRGPDSRSDHRPMLSDLRESGSIEQDADIVLFLYRDEYYDPNSEDKGLAECIVSKNRHGETGTVKLCWDGEFTRFRTQELFRNEG